MKRNYEPKLKVGDKVKIELEIEKIVDHPRAKYYHLKLPDSWLTNFMPDCKPFDKIAELVKKPQKKKKP